MTNAERIVEALLNEEDAEEFMQDVGFDAARGGKMFTLANLDRIDGELDEFKRAVIRRTGEIMPALIKRGIVPEDRSFVISRLITYWLADNQYNPKLWDDSWAAIYKRMVNVIRADMGWGRNLNA